MPSCLRLHYHHIPLTSPPPPLPSSAGPNFWKFAAFPLTLYIIEKAIRIRNAGHHAELKCLEVKKLADKVTGRHCLSHRHRRHRHCHHRHRLTTPNSPTR